MSTSTPPVATTEQIRAIDVPLGPAVLRRILPAVAAALSGGAAVLPLPADPRPARDAMVAALRPRVPLDHDGVALVIPTSGSTGEPKGVLLSADAVRASATATHLRLGGPGSWLLALPATHVAGLMVLARSVVAGTEPVALDLSGGFEPELFAAASVRLFAASSGSRYTALVPRQLGAILDTGDAALAALAGFDAVLVGGSSAGGGLLDRARAAGVTVVTTYGMTETSGGC
ncbi:MAG: AMP-binding protein, partial [Jiangellaceae bacterium]